MQVVHALAYSNGHLPKHSQEFFINVMATAWVDLMLYDGEKVGLW